MIRLSLPGFSVGIWFRFNGIGRQSKVTPTPRPTPLINGGAAFGQHLHNRIGNLIGEHKRTLFNRLSQGADLASACEAFLVDVSRDVRALVRKEKDSHE